MGVLMELRMGGKRIDTIHLQSYELGTDKILAATIKNGPGAVSEARIWTGAAYQGAVGIRLAGGGSWTHPGGSSAEGFPLGDLSANQEKAIEIKVNLVDPPGRPGENLIPLRVGHGEEI
jgi:hypothetical protein